MVNNNNKDNLQDLGPSLAAYDLLEQKQESQDIDELLNGFGYQLADINKVGRFYRSNKLPSVFIDHTLFGLSLNQYQYVDYTSFQNMLMHREGGLLRFVWQDLQSLKNDLDSFLTDMDEDLNLRRFGSKRDESHIDPTSPEFNFSVFFEETFGSKKIHALESESQYVDRKGHVRFIDFTLHRETSPIAVELNGEAFHHPLNIGIKRYRSQLFKQNSLVYDGYLVYRWSDRGMADKAKFADQMRDYFGDPSLFKSSPRYLAQRELSFDFYKHQSQAINKIDSLRVEGKNTFLVVLPVGTGKTEVFIEDVRKQFETNAIQRVLALVPSKALKEQLVTRLSKQVPNLKVSHEFFDKSVNVIVQTTAYALRHYQNQDSHAFDYILVDEAHHAAAQGLRKLLEHFNPKTLLGLTATDERLDRQKLEDIFGRYEVDLSLEEAVINGLVPPIRAFRLESNIDFSKVRFNGKEFVKSDINKTVLIPSRDHLIKDVLVKYFSKPLKPDNPLKQGVVFCVDVKHTKIMAKLLNEAGIKAAAVDGKNRKGIEEYQQQKVQFICACDLLNEGWDAPQTSILVMARPTMSKVLYTQQLGRGTRLFEGKEALYVIDVVDSYGANLQPWSLHSLFNTHFYKPFADVIEPEKSLSRTELISLDGLFEHERRLEPINIFNFEMEYGDLLNEEQLARELFISTGTLKEWVKKGDVIPLKSLSFGSKKLHYFEKDQVQIIRIEKNLKERTEDSRRDDFFEFLEKRDYTFSYKLIFLLAFIYHCNEQGEIKLEKLTEYYQTFYLYILKKYKKTDKPKSPYNREDYLLMHKELQKSLLANPFEKFERKRFVYQCKDLELVSFDPVLWDKLSQADHKKIERQYLQDAIEYFAKLDIVITEKEIQDILAKQQA